MDHECQIDQVAAALGAVQCAISIGEQLLRVHVAPVEHRHCELRMLLAVDWDASFQGELDADRRVVDGEVGRDLVALCADVARVRQRCSQEATQRM